MTLKRITADLDFKNPFQISLNVATALKYIKNIKEIKIYPSSSKGYHLIIWTSYNYDQKQIYKLRELIGDDKKRIELDKLRKIGKNTLFDKKLKYKYYDF